MSYGKIRKARCVRKRHLNYVSKITSDKFVFIEKQTSNKSSPKLVFMIDKKDDMFNFDKIEELYKHGEDSKLNITCLISEQDNYECVVDEFGNVPYDKTKQCGWIIRVTWKRDWGIIPNLEIDMMYKLTLYFKIAHIHNESIGSSKYLYSIIDEPTKILLQSNKQALQQQKANIFITCD